MVLPDPTSCESAELLGRHFAINLVLFVHLLLSVIAIILILYIGFVSTRLRRFFSLIHKNLKVVLYFGVVTFFAHSVLIIVLRAQSLISALRPSLSKCDYQWNTLNCLVLKVPIYYCVMSFSILHLGLFLERSIATYCFRNYSKFGYKVSVFILFLMFFITTCTVYYVYRNEDLNVPRAYCLSTTTKSAPQLQLLMIIACVADTLATIGDFIIYHENKRLKEVTSEEYTLAKKFQIRENFLSLHLIIPLSIIHSCFFMSYLVASIGLRSVIVAFDSVWHILTIELLQSAVCTYIIIMILSVLWLWQKIDQKKPDWLTVHPERNTADLYFEQLRSQMQNAHSRSVQQNEPNNTSLALKIFSCCKGRENYTM